MSGRRPAGLRENSISSASKLFGASLSPSLDAETIIAGAARYSVSSASNGLALNINSIGCPVCKPKYNEALARIS